jgi:hypothetical protein
MLQGLKAKSEQRGKMATDLIISYLFMRDGNYSERKRKVAEIFITKMVSRMRANRDFIIGENATLLKNYKAVIDADK